MTGRLLRDRYELLEELGGGGHGTVWRAFDHLHSRQVALKIRAVGTAVGREALLGEARTLLGLRPHGGLPLVREDFFENEQYVLVMDFVAGPDLADVLADRGDPGLGPSVVLAYLSQLAEALDHLHAHDPPVVHGDVKPANVVLGPEGRVVLVDFGLVGTGVSSGTKGYVAPEVAAGAPMTPAADVYGLAATAVALLTGSAALHGRPAWEGLDPALAAAVERGLRRGLALDPARRPGSAGELVERLRGALGASLPSGVVTFLLTDIVGSTALWDAHAETMGGVVAHTEMLIADAVDAHHGRLIKSRGEGDSTLSVFARASDAAAAALAVQAALARSDWPDGVEVTVRVALHTGEVEPRDGDYYGLAVNRAARLRGLAAGGQILCSQSVAELLADSLPVGASLVGLGQQSLRGLARAETVYALDHPELPRPTATLLSSTPAGGGGTEGVALTGAVDLPSWLATPGRTVLVGRDAELAILVQAVADGREGHRQGVLVMGEPGVGKTRLVGEAARSAREGGVLVLAGRCDPDLASAYGPFTDALRQVVGAVEPAALVGLLGLWPGELVRLVPELAGLTAGLPPPLVSDPETERWRLFDAVASALASLGEPGGLMLVVDDLQWATRPTLALLGHLLRCDLPQPLTLVATCRDTEVEDDQPPHEALLRIPGVARLSLEGLPQQDVAALVASALGRDLDPDGIVLARLLAEATGGNPLFVGELLRHLAETGSLERDPGGWTRVADPDELGLPQGVRDVIGLRLAGLGEVANDVLRAGAVAGVDFRLEVARALSGVDEEACLDALEAGAAAHLVVDLGADRWRFVHALVRAALYDTMSPSRRARRHAALARLLEQQSCPDPVALAHHWERAGSDGSRRAVGWLVRAGDEALAGLAPDQAAVFCTRALELDMMLVEGGLSPHQRISLAITLGIAQRIMGDPAHRETLLTAAHEAQALGAADLLASAALENTRGFWSVAGGVDQERIDVLERALAVLPSGDSPTRARLLARLAGELLFSAARDHRFTLADEALAIARRLDDDEVLADVLMARVTALLIPATLDQLWAEAVELVALGDRLADPGRRVLIGAMFSQVGLFAGRLEGMTGVLDRADALAAELGQPTLRWLVTSDRVVRPLLAGQLKEAEALAEAAFAYAEQAGQPDRLTWYGAQLYAVRYQQGRLGEVVEVLAQQAAQNPTMRVWQPALALAWVQADRLDEAAAVFDAIAADGFTSIPLDHYWLFTLALSAEVCGALGRADAAATLHELLAPWAHLPAGSGIVSSGSLERFLGIAAATAGWQEVAEAHFLAAITENERLGSPVFAALARLELASLLLERGGADDAEGAGTLVEDARTGTAALDVGWVHRRVQRLVTALEHH